MDYAKVTVASLWIVMIGLVGYLGQVTSVVGWAVMVAVALTAPLVMMHFWSVPTQSMSESIQEVLHRPDGSVIRGGRR